MKNTSHISNISYQIEKWLHDKVEITEIKNKIEEIKQKGFPENLELITGYADEKFGSSGCAFFNKDTGKVIVGFAGTNYRSGAIEGTKDVIIDAIKLGFTGMEEDCDYLSKPGLFIKMLRKKGYEIEEVTGHSLGGAIAVYMGIYYDIPRVVTYNGAPLYLIRLGDKSGITKRAEEYQGKIIRYVSKTDPLNSFSDSASGFYLGEERIIESVGGHAMSNFIPEEEKGYDIYANDPESHENSI